MPSKRTIPAVPRTADGARRLFDSTVKENLEIILAQRVDPIEQLSVNASTSDILAKVNEIIARLQE